MKNLLFALMLVFGLTISSSLFAEEAQQLTMEKVDELYATKKSEISWSDFDGYEFEDVGFGLIMRKYDLDTGQKLIIGGPSIDTEPFYIYLIDKDGNKTKVIRGDM